MTLAWVGTLLIGFLSGFRGGCLYCEWRQSGPNEVVAIEDGRHITRRVMEYREQSALRRDGDPDYRAWAKRREAVNHHRSDLQARNKCRPAEYA